MVIKIQIHFKNLSRKNLRVFIYFFSAGGIELLAKNGKIKVDNTLEARLNMVAEATMPKIRNALFGVNANRKFFD